MSPLLFLLLLALAFPAVVLASSALPDPIPDLPATASPLRNTSTTPAAAPAAPLSVSNSTLCIDPTDPQWRPIPCPPVRAAGHLEAAGTSVTRTPSFTLWFTCRGPEEYCRKARNALVFVGEQIKLLVRLPVGIIVNATLFSFCQEQGIGCEAPPPPTEMTANATQPLPTVARQIGNAAPALLIPLRDADGRVRFYPQALARQYRLPVHPTFAPADVIARFSTDANAWFPEDGVPIRRDQTDFRWVALHEILHGLGLGVTAWRDWARMDQREAQRLTPYPVTDLARDLRQGFVFDGEFFETVFDAGLVDVATQLPSLGRTRRRPRLSDMVTTRLNFFLGRTSPVRFASITEFDRALAQSPRAGRRAARIRDLTRTDRALAFDPEDGAAPILLASGPRMAASNPTGIIGHVDQDAYVRSPDFLMCPAVVSGVVLEEHRRRVVQFNNLTALEASWDGSFVGPHTRRILAYIGYEVYAPQERRQARQTNTAAASHAAGGESGVVGIVAAGSQGALLAAEGASLGQGARDEPVEDDPVKVIDMPSVAVV